MSSSSFPLAAAFCCTIVAVSLFPSATSSSGFSIDLIHRESPKSPFYNPEQTSYQRLQNSLRHSVSRAARFTTTITNTNTKHSAAAVGEPVSSILSNGGSYVMNISIGTPPFQIIGIADTGSDLIWTQCKPCPDCFDQRFPLFDPRKSNTYRNVSCTSNQCSLLEKQSSCSSKGSCRYEYRYGDQSYTIGDVALDTVSLASTSGKTLSFPKTIIGCGHNNQGTFDNNTSGIIGLGGGPVSLVSQIGKDRFSYCLVPFFAEGDKTSKLSFGSNAIVSGEGAVSTPLITKQEAPTFYFLTLLGFTVGDKRIDYVSSSTAAASSEEGNIIIDSGTTLTFLPEDIYSQVESEVAAKIPLDPVKTEFLSLCYKTQSDLHVPEITVHFDGDADLKLSPTSTFVRLDEETVCFAFKSSSEGSLAIYGNLAQMDYLVGYDKLKNVVAFKSADCSKF